MAFRNGTVSDNVNPTSLFVSVIVCLLVTLSHVLVKFFGVSLSVALSVSPSTHSFQFNFFNFYLFSLNFFLLFILFINLFVVCLNLF